MKGKLKWIVIIVIAIIVIGSIAGGSDSNEPKKTGEVATSGTSKNDSADKSDKKEKNTFQVGDIVETPDLKISFLSAKKYKSKNKYMQPKKGHIYYRMEFEFENIGDSDQTISSMVSWHCYADGYAVDTSYEAGADADDMIDATLSPGKKVSGAVYYEIPKKSKKITLEFETNFWSQDKIIFVAKK